MPESYYKSLLHKIDTFVFDVDGVLTNGQAVVTSEGEVLKTIFHKDILAMKKAVKKGFKILIISGGENEGIRKCLEELNLTEIYMGVFDKWTVLSNYIERTQVSLDQISYMGDEYPDRECMTRVMMPCCPKDASYDIKQISKYISDKKGGEGCARDIIEQTLRVQNKW